LRAARTRRSRANPLETNQGESAHNLLLFVDEVGRLTSLRPQREEAHPDMDGTTGQIFGGLARCAAIPASIYHWSVRNAPGRRDDVRPIWDGKKPFAPSLEFPRVLRKRALDCGHYISWVSSPWRSPNFSNREREYSRRAFGISHIEDRPTRGTAAILNSS